ncbi:calcium-transporting ATPase 12, plasma membrane-type-like [Olea europaea subsp. europaea]|uniref:Calcium-transporting ATPase 12, plasma membrane-type-like n=1 Tax=Olea europaea subsp. europaea TaxID=158383 RepID=A0A8S0PXB3_OLEEU|nr:calcium-transporting ATPase 12, plasma membrane-type-like [Olea europaea subsp. europaea]
MALTTDMGSLSRQQPTIGSVSKLKNSSGVLSEANIVKKTLKDRVVYLNHLDILTTMPSSSTFQASNRVSGEAVDSSTMVNIESSRFSSFDPAHITQLVRTQDKKWLREHGGIEGVLLALETDMENGVRGDRTDIDSRRKAFGSNLLPEYNL